MLNIVILITPYTNYLTTHKSLQTKKRLTENLFKKNLKKNFFEKTAGISTGSLVIEATRSSVRYYIILIGIKIKCSVLKRLLAPAWPSRLAGGPGFVPGCLILPQSPRPLCVPSPPLGSSQHSAY